MPRCRHRQIQCYLEVQVNEAGGDGQMSSGAVPGHKLGLSIVAKICVAWRPHIGRFMPRKVNI